MRGLNSDPFPKLFVRGIGEDENPFRGKVPGKKRFYPDRFLVGHRFRKEFLTV
jgi:hypothetical protein